MDQECAKEIQKVTSAILNYRSHRRNIIDWLVLVCLLLVVSLSVLWTTARYPSSSFGQYVCSILPPLSLHLSNSSSGPAQITLLHEDPCIRLVQNLITAEEAELLVRTYSSLLKPSTVSRNDNDKSSSSSRTSSSAFLPAGGVNNKLLLDIENRLVLITGIPISHWETLQLTKYTKGQEYKPHFDWFDDSGNNRTLTVFVYLNDVPRENGGETEFTDLNLSIQPKVGNAVIWFNCIARGKEVVCDSNTKHAGKPPVVGEKYGLNCWARTKQHR